MSTYHSGKDWVQSTSAARKGTRLAVDVAKRPHSVVELDPLARLVKVVPVTHRQHEQYLRWLIEKRLPRLFSRQKVERAAVVPMHQRRAPEPIAEYPIPETPHAPLVVAPKEPVASEVSFQSSRPMPTAVRKAKSRPQLPSLRLPKVTVPTFKPDLRFAVPALIAVVLLGAGLLFFQLRSDEKTPATNVAAVNQSRDVLGISTNEEPVVMTVSNKDAVTQPFLKGAENGDKVYLYYQSKKAVLFSGKTGELISHGDFTPPPAKVFVRKASVSANTQQVVDAIKADPTFSYVSQDTSPQPSYNEVLVIDITKRYPAELTLLAGKVKGTVVELPAGESVPDADILVLVGAR